MLSDRLDTFPMTIQVFSVLYFKARIKVLIVSQITCQVPDRSLVKSKTTTITSSSFVWIKLALQSQMLLVILKYQYFSGLPYYIQPIFLLTLSILCFSPPPYSCPLYHCFYYSWYFFFLPHSPLIFINPLNYSEQGKENLIHF